jgi:hypothetical protein
MRALSIILAGTAALCGLGSVQAQQVAGSSASNPTAANAQGDVAVTIYNGGQSLIEDVRQLNFGTGQVRIEFPDVSAQIRPQTVSFNASGTSIVEQNFDFDLLSPNALMSKAVGETVTLIRTNPGTGTEVRERAKVLAVNGGVVVQIGDRIEILRDDGLPVRVIFDKIPENLRAKPTLSVTVDSSRAGTRPARLSYLTNGLGWNADYVALYDEKSGTMDVQGWVTLTNNTGTTFKSARTLLVAGTPNGGGGYNQGYGRSGYYPPQPQYGGGMVRAGTETPGRESLGDYYLYPIKERTTIANAQTKQVSFLDVQAVPARKAYTYAAGWMASSGEPQSVASVLAFSSSKDGGLGDALPAGVVRFYMRDVRGDPQFIGENSIGHTPMGSQLALSTGMAFDVKVKTTLEKREKLGEKRWRTTMTYLVSNAKVAPVTVELKQFGLDWYYSDTKIISETLKSKRLDSNAVQWDVPVPANGEVTVTAVFETRY